MAWRPAPLGRHRRRLLKFSPVRRSSARDIFEPGWLIDASGVLGEPALPRGLPRLAVISG